MQSHKDFERVKLLQGVKSCDSFAGSDWLKGTVCLVRTRMSHSGYNPKSSLLNVHKYLWVGLGDMDIFFL